MSLLSEQPDRETPQAEGAEAPNAEVPETAAPNGEVPDPEVPDASTFRINRLLARSRFVLPGMTLLLGAIIGGGGLLLANSDAPVLVQIFALVLISIAAVLVLFGLGALVSAVVAGFVETEDDDGADR